MKLSFYGGARVVTGSCFMLEVDEQNILIDCGLQQSSDEFDNNALEFYSSRVDYMLLTHAHLDNAGRVPLLVKEGYYGQIFSTVMTKRMMNLMLSERAEMLESMAQWRNLKGLRTGVPPTEPLFTREDVRSALQQVETVDFHSRFMVCPGVEAEFVPSGHMPGAASIRLWVTEEGETRSLVFSGDLGNKFMPIAPPCTPIDQADFLVLSASHSHETYTPDQEWGNLEEFAKLVDQTLSHGGNLILPTFAVGRTQEILWALGQIKARNMVSYPVNFPVYLDSFLAEEAVNLFEGDQQVDLGNFSQADFQGPGNQLRFPGLHFCKTRNESKALNYDRIPKVILAGSAMCDRGRIKHHLKHNLWRKESTVALIGFLGEGSIGKRLIDGVHSVRLFGEEILVRAKIVDFRGALPHGDRPQLMEWLGHFQEKPRHIFVVKAENQVGEDFAAHLEGEGYSAHAPLMCQEYDLLAESVLEEGVEQERRGTSRRGRNQSIHFVELQDAVRLLDEQVHEERWNNNQELMAMTDQVNDLISAWKAKDLERKKY